MAATASAQDTPTEGGGSAAPPPPTAAPAATTTDPAFQKGTLGFSLPVLLVSNVSGLTTAVGGVPDIDLVYFLDDKSALDLIVGIDIAKTTTTTGTPPMTSSNTTFGFDIGAGYRMYKHKPGRLHTFMEPALIVSWPDTSDSSFLTVRAQFGIGAEVMLADWMSFGGEGYVGFSETDGFNEFSFATGASLVANLYWK
ncbi:MAG TPA: hypothetical protein VLX92_26490 [Kofleriaceae bacterium]|nr:hypothetical protein [Kofleriaceae bacterium]